MITYISSATRICMTSKIGQIINYIYNILCILYSVLYILYIYIIYIYNTEF